jgi:hypothetical protein
MGVEAAKGSVETTAWRRWRGSHRAIHHVGKMVYFHRVGKMVYFPHSFNFCFFPGFPGQNEPDDEYGPTLLSSARTRMDANVWSFLSPRRRDIDCSLFLGGMRAASTVQQGLDPLPFPMSG